MASTPPLTCLLTAQDCDQSKWRSLGTCVRPDRIYPTLTYIERSSIPVEQLMGMLNFDYKGRLAKLPAGFGAARRR